MKTGLKFYLFLLPLFYGLYKIGETEVQKKKKNFTFIKLKYFIKECIFCFLMNEQ